MKNRDKYTALLIAGLMSSSAAVAVVNSGDRVQEGTGTINISGHVTTTGCSASIDNTHQRFTLSHSDIGSVRTIDPNTGWLADLSSTITLTGCSGQWLSMNFTGANLIDSLHGYFVTDDGTIVNTLRYQVGLRGENVYGGIPHGDVHRTRVDGTQDLGDMVVVQVTSDSQTLDVVTQVKRHGGLDPAITPNRVSATYTYNMTYL